MNLDRYKAFVDKWVLPANSGEVNNEIMFMNDVEAAVRRSGSQFAFMLSAASAAVTVLFLIWANFAPLDEVTRGEGQVIPSLKTQVIQNLEGGIVSGILVSEGQTVSKDTVLIKIDNSLAESTFKEKLARSNFLEAIIARLESEISGKALTFPSELTEKDPNVIDNQKKEYDLRNKQREAQLTVLRTQQSQREQEVKELRSRLSQLQNNLSVVNREYNMTKPLVDKGVMAQVELLRIEGNKTDLEGEIRTINLSIPRAQSSAMEASQKIQEFSAGYNAEASKEMNAAKAEYESLKETLTAGEDKVKRTQVISPVDGTIKALHVNTVGQVIKPGENIAEITPSDDTLLVEAKIKPSDRAFIIPGQKAKIKITAYDFSIYGGLEGKVENISSDTIVDEKENSFYRITVRTDKTSLRHNGQNLPIMPGMTASVDIITGKKTVLDYLLKPILKTKENAFTER